ncbi:hypothetical protein ACIB24_21220 [Spongisporangium articulatum]|uniref:Phosphotyrosine protein phosphatase I domain-containing protein n=1 Tax=Spongisporangium articulatum TaxID=3362603 RepID=A0ABW8AVF2_9ACTN
MSPRVLLVCTANICRSPAAELLLAARLSPALDFFSRGVRAIPGAPMCDVSANWALMQGAGSGQDHVSTQLEVADIRAATLILTAGERHKAKVIGMRPSAQVRTYTLRQAARIIQWRTAQGMVPPPVSLQDRLMWLAEELDTYRGVAPRPAAVAPARSGGFFSRSAPPPAPSDSLMDPHEGGKHPEVLPQLIETIDVICDTLLAR